jgi:hypothetical protein
MLVPQFLRPAVIPSPIHKNFLVPAQRIIDKK